MLLFTTASSDACGARSIGANQGTQRNVRSHKKRGLPCAYPLVLFQPPPPSLCGRTPTGRANGLHLRTLGVTGTGAALRFANMPLKHLMKVRRESTQTEEEEEDTELSIETKTAGEPTARKRAGAGSRKSSPSNSLSSGSKPRCRKVCTTPDAWRLLVCVLQPLSHRQRARQRFPRCHLSL